MAATTEPMVENDIERVQVSSAAASARPGRPTPTGTNCATLEGYIARASTTPPPPRTEGQPQRRGSLPAYCRRSFWPPFAQPSPYPDRGRRAVACAWTRAMSRRSLPHLSTASRIGELVLNAIRSGDPRERRQLTLRARQQPVAQQPYLKYGFGPARARAITPITTRCADYVTGRSIRPRTRIGCPRAQLFDRQR
jgi:hypothetical protein